MKGFGLSTLLCGIYLLSMSLVFSSETFQESGFLFNSPAIGEAKGDFANHPDGKSMPQRIHEEGQGGESASAQAEEGQQGGARPIVLQKDLIRDLYTAPGGQTAFLSLEGQGRTPVIMEVYDISGTRILKRESILEKGENRFVFNMQYVKDGIYLFKASTLGRESFSKLVKQSVSTAQI